MSIKLLDYQQEAINRIFSEENSNENKGLYGNHRSAAVVLPTGGGKSFVAMRAIEKMIETNNPPQNNSEHPNALSLFKMHYFAPNTGIIYQFRLHMAEHMVLNHYYDLCSSELNTDFKDKQIEYILNKMFPKTYKNIDYNSVYTEILSENSNAQESKTSEEIAKEVIKRVIRNQPVKELTNLVNRAYPNINFECYQNLPHIDIKSIDSDFFIFDEAHRGGAKTWLPKLQKLVSDKKDKYFLSITATPERNNDDNSLLTTIASKTGYTSNEITNEEYYAKEYYLKDAIRDGRVISPKIIGFACTLDQSPEYISIVEKISELEEKRPKGGSAADKKLEALRAIRDKMDEIIGKRIDGKTLSEAEWAQKKQQLIEEKLNNTCNPHGKYIAFIPDSTGTQLTEEDEQELAQYSGQDPEYKKKKESSIRSKRNVINYTGRLDQLFSDEILPLVYHASNSEEKNVESLQQFCSEDSKSGKLKFIITNKKLDEGVHVEDADGAIMFDVIQSTEKGTVSNRFLQQIGRCIRAIKPNENTDEIKVPIIYDYANNFMRNLEHLKLDDEIIFEYDQDSQEVSNFFELAGIAKSNPASLMKISKDGHQILRFNLGAKKGNIDFPSNTQLKFSKKKTAQKRYNQVISLLEILEKSETNPPINLQSLPLDTIINDEFFTKYNYTKQETERIKLELINKGIISPQVKEFNLGEEVSEIKQVFFGIKSDAAMKKVLSNPDIDLEKLSRFGIIYLSQEERISKDYEDIVDYNGFIKPSLKLLNNDNQQLDIEFLEKFVGINVNTGTKYYLGKDEYGCYEPGTTDEYGNDISGYDIYGYDRYGFNKEGVHRLTGQKYNERFFVREQETDGNVIFRNIYTGKAVDVFGYNIDGINPDTGFDRGTSNTEYIKHYWHKFDKSTGKFSRLHTEYDLDKDPPVDEYGATRKINPNDCLLLYNFNKNRRSCDTGEYRDSNGINIDGFDINGFKQVDILEEGEIKTKFFHEDTSSEYDTKGRNYKGELEPNFKNGIEILETIFKYNNSLKSTQNRNKLVKYLQEKYETKDMTIDDILDKALTVYRMCSFTDRDELFSRLSHIKECFSNTNGKYDESIDFIDKIGSKFKTQIASSTDYRKQMNEIINSKANKLINYAMSKYSSKIPNEILKRLNILSKISNKKDKVFLTEKESNDPMFRDF